MMLTLCTGSTPVVAAAASACPISWKATISRSRGFRRRFFFSRPATMRSMAASKSWRSTASAFRRVALSAASLTRLARSAPVKPGVSGAIDEDLTVEAASAEQRRIEDLRSVGGADQHDARALIEAVELDQELIQG